MKNKKRTPIPDHGKKDSTQQQSAVNTVRPTPGLCHELHTEHKQIEQGDDDLDQRLNRLVDRLIELITKQPD